MKKIIALALVLVMALSMTTVAFAADVTPSATTAYPGDEIKFPLFSTGTFNTADWKTTLPTSMTTLDGLQNYFSSDYFNVKVEYEKGKDLVKEVKLDGTELIVVLKESTAEITKLPNLIFKSIKIEGKKDANKTDKAFRSVKVEWKNTMPAIRVGFPVQEYTINDNGIVAPSGADFDGAIAKFVKGNADYGTFEETFLNDIYVSGRVYKDEKMLLKSNNTANIDLVKANPDAELTFYNFVGKPAFSSNMEIEVSAEEDAFLYEIKDGKLVKSNLKWNADAYAFTGKTRVLGSYVISDIELKDVPAKDEETKNPNTGANDFVGVAVALAVVSLVAAGAVSLKK